jgi:hypothetical protein
MLVRTDHPTAVDPLVVEVPCLCRGCIDARKVVVRITPDPIPMEWSLRWYPLAWIEWITRNDRPHVNVPT